MSATNEKNKNAKPKNFYSLKKGYFTKSVPSSEKDAEGVTSYQDKNGITRYKKEFNTIEGFFHRLYTYDEDRIIPGQVKRMLVIEILDSEADLIEVIQLFLEDRVSAAILKRLPMINVSQQIKLKSYYFADENKQMITIFQNDEKVESIFTKENPNGLPELKEVVINNKKMYDNTERTAFFEDLIKKFNALLTDFREGNTGLQNLALETFEQNKVEKKKAVKKD